MGILCTFVSRDVRPRRGRSATLKQNDTYFRTKSSMAMYVAAMLTNYRYTNR